MKEILVSVVELSDITGVHVSMLRPWLGNFRLSKFITKAKLGDRYKLAVRLNKHCAYRLCEVFMTHQRDDAVKKLEKFFEEQEDGNKWFWHIKLL